MRLTQKFLREQLLSRIKTSRPELELAGLMTTADAARLLAAQPRTDGPSGGRPDGDVEEPGITVVSVVRRFDLTSWIRGTCAFASGLSPDQVRAWRRSFTRTAFLTGNPDNLLHRFDFAHVSEDRLAAWTVPAEARALATLRRLLKLFDGPRALPQRPEHTLVIPAAAGPRPPGRAPMARGLYLSTAGVTLAESMVNLNHLLAEAVIDGLIAPGDRLRVRQVPRLVGITEPPAALRVGVDGDSPDRLRAFAVLTKEIDLD
jgi:uncharacterized protein DUF6182